MTEIKDFAKYLLEDRDAAKIASDAITQFNHILKESKDDLRGAKDELKKLNDEAS